MKRRRDLSAVTGLTLDEALQILGRSPADLVILEQGEMAARRAMAIAKGLVVNEKELRRAAHQSVAGAYIRRAHQERSKLSKP